MSILVSICKRKINKMNIKSIFPILASLLIIFTCNDDKNKISQLSEIPQLLERPSKLTGLEWDNVQNKYQSSIVRLKINPLDSKENIKLAEVFMHEARVTGEHGHYYPAAISVLDASLKNKDTMNKDDKFHALLYKASVMLSQHEFETAKKLALEALKINTYNAQLYGTLVDAYVELGDYDLAVKMADKMVSIRPDIRSYSRISYLREIHGDLAGAIEAMEMAAESGYPGLEQTAWARLTLGDLYIKNKQRKKAESCFNQILNERQNYPFAIAALGKMRLDEKNYEEAEELLLKAANIIPEVGYYIDLADLYKQTNRMDLFNEKVAEIKVMLQDDVDSGHNMNLEYADFFLNITEDDAEAFSYAQKEYEIRPVNADVNKMMAKVCLKNGKHDQAKLHLQKAMILNAESKELKALQKLLASN